MSGKNIFTIITTSADVHQGFLQSPTPDSSFFSFEKAKERMEKLVKEEKNICNSRCNTEEISEGLWYVYEEGYANDCFIRIEILESEIQDLD